MNETRKTEFLGTGTAVMPGSDPILINGEVLASDDLTAYVEMYLAHSWPVVTTLGWGIHSGTLLRSYRSMKNKVFNLGHLMRNYDRHNIGRDRILGTVVQVELCGADDVPVGGVAPELEWPSSVAGAYRLRAVAAVHKQADGVDKLFGGHASGRRKFNCSMEVTYYPERSGFLVGRGSTGVHAAMAPFQRTTPEPLVKMGQTYVEWEHAPESLRKCYSIDQGKMTKKFDGCDACMLIGGLDGQVQFVGIGAVDIPREPSARVTRLVAGEDLGSKLGELVDGLDAAARALRS